MRAPSRRMYPLPPERTLSRAAQWGCLLTLALGLTALLWWYFLPTVAVLAVVTVKGWLASSSERYPPNLYAALIKARLGDGLCRFAREFDCRATDTWLIRATFEAVGGHCRTGDTPVPVRAEDRLDEDLGLDGDDLEDIGMLAARWAGYSLEGCERNPLYAKVATVRDIVDFLRHQPCIRLPAPKTR